MVLHRDDDEGDGDGDEDDEGDDGDEDADRCDGDDDGDDDDDGVLMDAASPTRGIMIASSNTSKINSLIAVALLSRQNDIDSSFCSGE